jgi:hypothetical protein
MKTPDEPESAGSPRIGRLQRSPLTDPRALASSLAVHVVLLAIASALALRVAAPRVDPAPSRTLLGELEPVDNRAEGDPGGGGDPEGRSAEVSAEKGLPSPPTRDPAADALLSEVLPTRSTAEPVPQTLPGPSTSGLGMLAGPDPGDGGGKGGGSGGGNGPGTGPGTQFFGMRDRGGSFAYVIDCSGSMTARGSLDVAKRELLASLAQVPPEARFAVVFYNIDANVFTDAAGRPGLMAATASNKARVRTLLATVQPDKGTDHMLALRAALALHPEVIFFLTDADLMSRQDVAAILAEAGKTRIQAVEFGLTGGVGGSAPLKLLARSTGGSYRYIDVNSFGR